MQLIDNLLPQDGEVYYFPGFLPETEVKSYMQSLRKGISWKQDEVIMFGKRIFTQRKTAWYGSKAYAYTYSKITRYALPWTPDLAELKSKVDLACETQFNTCLLNLYHSGGEGMAWHSDDEKELGLAPIIASVSLGAKRRFVFKHKVSKEKVELALASGSLLLMKGTTQQYWLHSLPKTKKVSEPRINLTFRIIVA